MEWQPIETVEDGARVIVFVPNWADDELHNGADPCVFEAVAYKDGSFGDPVYSEWDGDGATMWAALPPRPSPPNA